jgi:hypothetical protein
MRFIELTFSIDIITDKKHKNITKPFLCEISTEISNESYLPLDTFSWKELYTMIAKTGYFDGKKYMLSPYEVGFILSNKETQEYWELVGIKIVHIKLK